MAPIATRELQQVNGFHEKDGVTVVIESSDEAQEPLRDSTKLSPQQDLVLKTFRLLIADLCQQFNGGHGGSAVGAAAIGVALWKYAMSYAPHTPEFVDRDRFVLSNGHVCLFQYAFLHLTGYKAMTLEQLKSYHSPKVDTLCPGHPEIEIEGIEVTTGPLGQGVGNAVGMAMAAKHLAATYNRPGFDMISNHIWCMVGDACLQEGVALEAVSLAGHLKLNNLTVIYDNNQVTCDGSVDLTNSEDVNTKMIATGWHVIDVEDGCFDIEGLVSALNQAKTSPDKPTFINVRTVIGLGSAMAGTSLAHGDAFGAEDIANMKRVSGFDSNEHFVIPNSVQEFFADTVPRGYQLVRNWHELFRRYSCCYPEPAAELASRLRGDLPPGWESHIPANFPPKLTATRVSSGLVFNPIAEKINSFMVGSADLSDDVEMLWTGAQDFQHPGLRPQCGIMGSYAGRYIRYGIREHAMAAIANGLAAYQPNMIIPVTSSFLVFYLYAAAAVRTGALQRLQVIHVGTHDSIGMGEGGPTHQPIEVAALFRAMPNFLYIRPADSEETAGAWIAAIQAKNTPSLISNSRHGVPQLTPWTRRMGVLKGAYVLDEAENADVTVIGVGAELHLAIEVAIKLRKASERKVRVVSFPCHRLFEKQSLQYRRDVLQRHRNIPAIVIEPYAALGWERYADAAICMSTDRFGQSLPCKELYEFFGFESGIISEKIVKYLDGIERKGLLRGDFVEL